MNSSVHGSQSSFRDRPPAKFEKRGAPLGAPEYIEYDGEEWCIPNTFDYFVSVVCRTRPFVSVANPPRGAARSWVRHRCPPDGTGLPPRTGWASYRIGRLPAPQLERSWDRYVRVQGAGNDRYTRGRMLYSMSRAQQNVSRASV